MIVRGKIIVRCPQKKKKSRDTSSRWPVKVSEQVSPSVKSFRCPRKCLRVFFQRFLKRSSPFARLVSASSGPLRGKEEGTPGEDYTAEGEPAPRTPAERTNFWT